MSMLGGGALFSQSTQPLLESAPVCAPRALMEVMPQGSHRFATWLTRERIDSPNVLLACAALSNPVVEESISAWTSSTSPFPPSSCRQTKMASSLAQLCPTPTSGAVLRA